MFSFESRLNGALNPRLGDLVDSATLQPMMDDFFRLTSMPSAIIDLDGVVLVGSGWQKVCTDYHRANPDSCAHCIESDTVLTAEIPEGEARLYRCKNGMWDAATPIHVGGEKLGNLFIGQFFFEDEPVNIDYFREQAGVYGFDERSYLASLESVPRLSRSTVDTGLRFLTRFSSVISQLMLSGLERERAEGELRAALEGQKGLTHQLSTERAVLEAVMENTDTHLAYLDPEFNFVAVNNTYAAGSGHARDELLGRNHFDLFPNAENQSIFERARETGEPVEFRAKPFWFEDQPWRGITYWDWRLSPIWEDGTLNGFAFSLQDVSRNVREQAYSGAINRLNEIIHGTLDFGSVLEQFVPQLAATVGCEVVAVWLRDPAGQWTCRELFGLPDELKRRHFSDEQLPMAMDALRTGRPVSFGSATPDSWTNSLAASLGVDSVLIAPLVASIEPLGAISCGFTSGPGVFEGEQIDFVGKIASSLSLALQNARLYEAQHHIADKLQEALLSLPSSVEGTEFVHLYHSATEATRVGGDFYDLFELDDGRLAIVIGDVAGKGLDAAVLTSLVKDTIRAHASEQGKTPRQIVELTNRLVLKSTPTEAFVTVFFGVLDRSESTLAYVNAGHTSGVIRRANGRTDRLATTGCLLGAFEEAWFEVGGTRMDEDDLLFLYTDGLTEARYGIELYGEDRMVALLEGSQANGLEELVGDVIGDVISFCGGHLHDDVAILALRCERPAGVPRQERLEL